MSFLSRLIALLKNKLSIQLDLSFHALYKNTQLCDLFLLSESNYLFQTVDLVVDQPCERRIQYDHRNQEKCWKPRHSFKMHKNRSIIETFVREKGLWPITKIERIGHNHLGVSWLTSVPSEMKYGAIKFKWTMHLSLNI